MKFSIIVPTFKRPGLLAETLNSIASQTYKNYEIIVVNDNIDDKDVIEQLCKNYPDIQVLHHPHPQGANTARNNGIKKSNGDIIAFVDDDDTWVPEKLEEHYLAHSSNPDIAFVYSDCTFFWDDPSKGTKLFETPIPADVNEAMKNGVFCPATSSSVTIKRICFDDCGFFDESLVSFQDWDMWFRISFKYKFKHIADSLVNYRQSFGASTSTNIERRLKGLKQIMDKWKGVVYPDNMYRKFKIDTYYWHSRNLMETGHRLEAFKFSFRLFEKDIFGLRDLPRFLKLQMILLLGKHLLNLKKD